MSFSSGLLRIAAFVVAAVAVVLTLPRLSPVLFPAVPEPSATFDCDDGTLAMYRHFEELGIAATPMVGNLTTEGEAYMECNHVWLIVESGDTAIAYDWGEPQFDRQHYEGYVIGLDTLQRAVDADRQGGQVLASADY